MSADRVTEPTGYLQCFFRKRITVHKKFYFLFLSACLLTVFISFLGIWAALPFSVREKYGHCKINCQKIWNNSTQQFDTHCEYRPVCKYAWTIPILVLGFGCLCYFMMIGLIMLQKSHCCRNPAMLKDFLLSTLCLPYGTGNLFLSDENIDRAGECACIPLLPNDLLFLGANCCPTPDLPYSGHQISSLTSWLFIPFTFCLSVLVILIIIVAIPFTILFGLGWCFWRLLKLCWQQIKSCSCTWNHCDCCGFVEIDTLVPEYSEVDDL